MQVLSRMGGFLYFIYRRKMILQSFSEIGIGASDYVGLKPRRIPTCCGGSEIPVTRWSGAG